MANPYKTITTDELFTRLNEVVLINVLEPEYNQLGMIRGSKRIPLSQLAQRMGELNPEKEVVVYCAGYECDASKKAAQMLADAGYHVSAYEGGIHEWTAAKLPFDPAGSIEDNAELPETREVK